MKKYLFAIILTAMLSTSLAGCGMTENKSSSNSAGEKTTQAETSSANEAVTTETETNEMEKETSAEPVTTEAESEIPIEAVTTEAESEISTEPVTTEAETEIFTEIVTTDAVNETPAEEVTTEAEEAKEVFALNGPLARKQNVSEFNNAKVPASFTMNDLVQAYDGTYTLTVTLYGYEYFSAKDITALNVGDTVYCLGNPVKVETAEISGDRVIINGGIENGGRVFRTNDYSVYYESGMNDMKSYYTIGVNSYTLAEDFTMTDNAVMESPKTYTASEFAALSDDVYGFRNRNTIVNTTDGVISSIVRNYTP